jgi:hypothetical protein
VIRAAGDQGGNGGGPVREPAPPSQPVVQQALADWQSAGASAAQSAQLRQVSVSIHALPASYLGEEAGNQFSISSNAAGSGWKLGARASTGLEDSDNLQDVIW